MKFLIIGSKNAIKKEEKKIIIELLREFINIHKVISEEHSLTFFFDEIEQNDFKNFILNLSLDLENDFNIYVSKELDHQAIEQQYSMIKQKMGDIPVDIRHIYLDDKELLKYDLENKTSIEDIKKQMFKKYYKDQEMLKTIKVYLEANQNMSVAAKKLYVHRNTLIQRIERFNSETGLDVKTFIDGYLVYSVLTK